MSGSSYQAQAYARVWQIQQMLHPKPSDLISASRFFIREGELMMWHQKKRKKSKRYFFLFNDIMLLTKRQSSKKYLLRIHITLRSPSVSVETIESASFNWEFRLHCRTRSFILYANGEEDRQFWTTDIEKSIKGTHEEEKKTKEKLESGETKIPTQEVASPRKLSPRGEPSPNAPENVKASGSGKKKRPTDSARKSDDSRARSQSELPKKSASPAQRASSTAGVPSKKLAATKATPDNIRSSPGMIQNESLVSPVPFENAQTGIFVYPNPMMSTNPFLDVPAANQNPFATNTFSNTANPYATNSPFAPNPNRMSVYAPGGVPSPFATTPAAFGQANAFSVTPPPPSTFGSSTFGSATFTSSPGANPFATTPALTSSNPTNPFATNSPTPRPVGAVPQPTPGANPFMTNNANPFATNNANPFGTTPQSGGHYF